MAPKHFGKPHLVSNPSTILLISCSEGILIYRGISTLTIALQVSATIKHTVERPTPNRWETVLCSQDVARVHKVISTLFSMLIALRKEVSCFSMQFL